jgi:hypothetical protein
MIFIDKRVFVGVILCISLAFATNYHEPDLFPLGFSGFSYTGYYGEQGNADNSPYPDDSTYGTWAWEDTLLSRTHCNFIGSWYKFDKYMNIVYTGNQITRRIA